MRVECVFCAYAKVAWASRPLCERAPVIPARGLISKGNTRVNLLQGTLSQAGTPALPSHRSPFHQKHDPRAPPVTNRLRFPFGGRLAKLGAISWEIKFCVN